MERFGARQVAIAEGYAYVAVTLRCNEPSRLEVLDVSDPQAPRVVGSLDLVDEPIDVAAEGQLVYLLGQSYGPDRDDMGDETYSVSVIEHRRGEHLRVLASTTHRGYAYAMAVSGDHVYVSASGLQVFSAERPGTLALVGTHDLAGGARDIKLAGGLA
jgi:hypothetical protein